MIEKVMQIFFLVSGVLQLSNFGQVTLVRGRSRWIFTPLYLSLFDNENVIWHWLEHEWFTLFSVLEFALMKNVFSKWRLLNSKINFWTNHCKLHITNINTQIVAPTSWKMTKGSTGYIFSTFLLLKSPNCVIFEISWLDCHKIYVKSWPAFFQSASHFMFFCAFAPPKVIFS